MHNIYLKFYTNDICNYLYMQFINKKHPLKILKYYFVRVFSSLCINIINK